MTSFVGSGYQHSLFLDSCSSVWSCGRNSYGQLGLGDFTSRCSPTEIINLPPILSVSAGYYSSLLVDTNGEVWACGYNQYGELGLGDCRIRNRAEKITSLPKSSQSAIALGYSSFFLDCEGSIWACGCNGNGLLGLGDLADRINVEKIEGLPKITAIAGGSSHSLFLDIEGSVWACGSNGSGQLGLENTRGKHKAEKIEGLPKITKITGGGDFSMFVDEAGAVWGCGSNLNGALGLVSNLNLSRAVQIESLSQIDTVTGGYNCSMFLDKQGNLFTCGTNAYSQLGHGDKNRRTIPQKVEGIPPIAALSNCNSSYNYFQVVDTEGRVWSCGKNEFGQLGLGDNKERDTFAQVVDIPRVGHAKVPTKSARKVI